MSKLVLLLVLLSLGLSSCAPVKRFWFAPHRTIRHYHHWQRKHERERQRRANDRTNVSWSSL
jgi:transposase-like protein